MLGAIIGDIVGSVYEWNNIKTKEFPLFSEKCFFTDDTIMTIAVADALLNGGAPENFIDSMKSIGGLYPRAGYGGGFRKWLFSDDREPYNSWGNGSAMRVAPCGWFAKSIGEAEALAERSAAVTHNHPEGIKGAQATAAAIYLARLEEPMDRIKEYIERKYGYNLSRTLDEIRPEYAFNESCQETVPEAIIAFLESTGFEDAIRNAISLGGDSDTLAAITGSIAEAMYGIPADILSAAFYILDDRLASVINAWLDRDSHSSSVVKPEAWKTEPFSKPHSISTDIRFSDRQFARIRYGLYPEQMEDKWFVYYDDNRLHCYRSWTGMKVYEAEIKRSGGACSITEIITERDPDRYDNTDDEDIRLFNYLFARGLMRLSVEVPHDESDPEWSIKAWSNFGRMIL